MKKFKLSCVVEFSVLKPYSFVSTPPLQITTPLLLRNFQIHNKTFTLKVVRNNEFVKKCCLQPETGLLSSTVNCLSLKLVYEG